MRRRSFIGVDVGSEFSWMEPVDSYFHSFGSVVIFGSIIISSPSGGVVLAKWNGFLWDYVIVVLANDKHGGCVGV